MMNEMNKIDKINQRMMADQVGAQYPDVVRAVFAAIEELSADNGVEFETKT
jgi:hypothetical protein